MEILLGLLICCLLSHVTEAKIVEGHLETKEDWAFLTRFCFLSEKGRLEFQFEYPQIPYEPQNILLYYDEADQWPAVYKSDKSCRQKEAVLQLERNQVVFLEVRHYSSGCWIDYTEPNKTVTNCNGFRQFQSARERWWFIAASHCDEAQVQTCLEKESVLNVANNQVLNLTRTNYLSGCVLKESDANTGGRRNNIYDCFGASQFNTQRARWWYVAVSNCKKTVTCAVKTDDPHIKPGSNQLLALDSTGKGSWPSCRLSVTSGKNTTVCDSHVSFRSSRERWWYIAASRCNAQVLPTCQEMIQPPHITQSQQQEILLQHSASASRWPYCARVDSSGVLNSSIIVCQASVTFLSRRERWWYIATSSCKVQNGLTCEEKCSPPHIIEDNNQILVLHPDKSWPDCINHDDTGTTQTWCNSSLSFRSSRARWWFITAARCVDDGASCLQKVSEPHIKGENNQVIVLHPDNYWSGCTRNNTRSQDAFGISFTVQCDASRRFRSFRERWWYVAVSHCAEPGGSTVGTCVEKLSSPHIVAKNNQKIVLHRNEYWSGCSPSNDTSKGAQLKCVAGRSFRSARERWWFIALSRCTTNITQTPVGLNLKYKMTMTNGESIFFKHFSADEFYILQTDIAFLVLTVVILALSVYVAYILQVDIAFLVAVFLIFLLSIKVAAVLRTRQLFHTTYKLYMTSLVLECIHLFTMCLVLGSYANSGKENYSGKTFGRILEAASVLVFLLMLILMGKGYTITRGRLSTSGSMKIAVFMTLYVITYAVLFIYEANFFDPGEVLYLYESPAGYGLIAMRLIGWLWFCYAIFFTLKHYPEKSKFYYPFFVFYTVWFWAGPVVILIAMKAMPLWVREKVVNGVENTVTFIGFCFFLILTRPSAANNNFPYHVRTTQIGVMHPEAPTTADKETNSFNSSHYAPTQDFTQNGAPNFTELFTVSNSRSNGQGSNGYDNQSYETSGLGRTGRTTDNPVQGATALPINGGENVYDTIDPPPYSAHSFDNAREVESAEKKQAEADATNPTTNPDSFPHQKPDYDPFCVTK